MLDTLTADIFEPLVDSIFTAAVGEHADRLTLVQVERSRFASGEGMRAPFTLVFVGERSDLCFENLVELSHPAIGTVLLSLSPMLRLPRGNREYQVSFS
jgi:hypothetical protein